MVTRRKAAAPAPAQPHAEAARGEHALTLGGVTYRLRPSRQAIRAAEDALALSLIQMARQANVFSLPLDKLAVLVAELIRAGAAPDDRMTRAVSAERIEELIFEEGLAPVFATVAICLFDAVSGGRTASGEAKAVAITSKAVATA